MVCVGSEGRNGKKSHQCHQSHQSHQSSPVFPQDGILLGAVGAYDWNGAVLKETSSGKVIPLRESYLQEFPEELKNHGAYLGGRAEPGCAATRGKFGILSLKPGYSSWGAAQEHPHLGRGCNPGAGCKFKFKFDLNSGASEPAAGHPQLFLEWSQSADGISCLGRKYLLG